MMKVFNPKEIFKILNDYVIGQKNQNRFCQSQYTTTTKGLTTKIKIIVMWNCQNLIFY